MPLLRKLAALNRYERKAAVEAALIVPAIRLGLWLAPFRMVRCWVDSVSSKQPMTCAPDPALIGAAIWAVLAVSSRVPAATCLTQAFSAKVLLARRGCSTTLRVGVVRRGVADLHAHAWLERDGEVLIGGTPDVLQDYATLSKSGESRP